MIINNIFSLRIIRGDYIKHIVSTAVFSLSMIICVNISLAESLSPIIKVIIPSVVHISTFDKNGNSLLLGSGFFIDKYGSVVTNRHVMEGAYNAQIKAANGKLYSVEKILNEDIEGDIIRVSVNVPTSLSKPLKFSDGIPSIGERVIIVGSPLGLDQSVSDGIISSIREVKRFGKVIQITAPISSGSSGSPVVNMKGEVIGIATFQATKGQNINFAIPVSRVKNYTTPVNMTVPQWEETREKVKHRSSSGKQLSVKEGFRELPWDIEIEDALNIYPDLTKIKYNPEREAFNKKEGFYYYYRKNDNKELAGVTFNDLKYFFINNRFYSASASIDFDFGEEEKCKKLYGVIYENIMSNYGKPSNEIKKEENDIKVVVIYWIIDKASITVDYSQGGISGPLIILSVSSNKIYNKSIGF